MTNKPTKVEALELTVRHILYLENMSLLEHGNELNVGHIEEIAKAGIQTFKDFTNSEELSEQVQNKLQFLREFINPSEETSEEQLHLKESIFGKNQKSCVLRLFQTLLIK